MTDVTNKNDLSKLDVQQLFEKLKISNSSRHIVQYFYAICNLLNIDLKKYYTDKNTQITITTNATPKQPSIITKSTTRILYQIIRTKFFHWKALELFKIFDQRAQLKDFIRQSPTKDLKTIIIGCGPVGLRLAIDLALLGQKVAIVEKRDR
jgi:hypothetical protein